MSSAMRAVATCLGSMGGSRRDSTKASSAWLAAMARLPLQNLVDPDEVPLDLYPRLYELLFAPLIEPGSAEPDMPTT